MNDFERIKDTLKQFNAQAEQFDLNALNDEEYEEVSALMDQTISLLTGGEEYEDDEDSDDLE